MTSLETFRTVRSHREFLAVPSLLFLAFFAPLVTSVITSLIVFFPSASLAEDVNHQSVLVLVPGFFNNLAPGSLPMRHQSVDLDELISPYFSSDIVALYRSRGLTTYVVNNLQPVGTIEQNGKLLMQFLDQVVERHQRQPVILLAHSAGGLYSMYALTHGHYPVTSLLTISTPYTGVEVSNLVEDSLWLEDLLQWLNLDSLAQLSTRRVRKFLQTVQLPVGLRVVSIAGEQRLGNQRTWRLAEFMSFPLWITGQLIFSNNDGIVSVPSALAENLQFKDQDGNIMPIERWLNDGIPLEHWEQVLDYRLFKLLNVKNVDFIRQQQIKFYNRIADLIGQPKEMN